MPDDFDTMVAKETVAILYRRLVDAMREMAEMPETAELNGREMLELLAERLESAIEKTTI